MPYRQAATLGARVSAGYRVLVVAAHAHNAFAVDRNDDPARRRADPAIRKLVSLHGPTLRVHVRQDARDDHTLDLASVNAMTGLYERSAEVAEIRNRIGHPIIDGDGHIIEYLPLVRDVLVELAGAAVAERFDLVVASGHLTQMLSPAQRREMAIMRLPWWGIPTRNTLDRATAMLP